MIIPKLKNINSYLIFQVLRFGNLLLINIIMAKSHLSMFDLGRFESFTFYASALSFFWITGLSQTLLSLSNKKEGYDHDKKLVYNTFLLFLTLSILGSFILMIGKCINHAGIIPGLTSSDNFLLALYLFFYPLGFLIEFILLINKQYRSLILFAVLSFLLTLMIVPLPAFSGFGVEYSIYGLIILAVLKVILLLILLKQYAEISIDKIMFLKLINVGLPLILTALIAGSAAYIDGLIISLNFDNQTFAVFRYGAREFPLFLLISGSFGLSVLPLFSNREILQSNLKLIKNKSGQYIRHLFPLAILFLCFSQLIFKNLFNENFYDSYVIFDIYLLLVISRFVFPATILIGFQKNNLVFYVSLIELGINILFSLLFVKWIGFTGVAFGTVLAYFSEKIILVILVKHKLNISYTEYIPFKDLTIFSVLILFVFIFKMFIIS